MSAASTTTTRVVHATPDRVYRAFMDPNELVAWLPPGPMRGLMHAFDAREGGGYRMSLFYPPDEAHVPGKTAAHEDLVIVRFEELVPGRRIVEAVDFVAVDPAYAGEMRLEITFAPDGDGTRVTMAFTNLPPGLRPEDNEAGARESLAQLAAHLERSTV